jgi:hypothetical protein
LWSEREAEKNFENRITNVVHNVTDPLQIVKTTMMLLIFMESRLLCHVWTNTSLLVYFNIRFMDERAGN